MARLRTSRSVRTAVVRFMVVTGIIVQTTAGVTATLQLPQAIYPYTVVEQELSVVLREFGQNAKVRIEISPKIKGMVKGPLPRLHARAFLDRLCEAYNLEWYYDGSTLYVTSVAEQSTKFLQLGKHSAMDLRNAMTKMSFYDERYGIKDGPDEKSVVITGPPRYLALAERTLASLSNPQQLVKTNDASKTVVYRASQTSVLKFGPDDRPVE